MTLHVFIQNHDENGAPTMGQNGYRVAVDDPARLEENSAVLRERIRRAESNEIVLTPNPALGISRDDIGYLVKNLGRTDVEIPNQVTPAGLSQHCSALWCYQCRHASFDSLWDALPWWNMENDGDGYCWRRFPCSDTRIKRSVHLAQSAFVLEKDNVFRSEIEIAIWGSRRLGLPTAIGPLQNLAGKCFPHWQP